MYGAGWGKVTETERKPPESCAFCGTKIEEGYWIGRDLNGVLAETCLERVCWIYLVEKVRR